MTRGASRLWPMRPWQRWLALGLVVAALAHLATVWALPRLIMREAMARIAQETAAQSAPQAATGVYLPPPTDHTQRRIVMPSPDLLYATCALDLSKGPVRITAQVDHPRYWSIALYGANSDNFFVVNDRVAAAQRLDLWVTPPGSARAALAAEPEATLVEAPSTRALLLMRLLLTDDPADLAMAQVARATLRCGGEPADASPKPIAGPAQYGPSRTPTPFEAGSGAGPGAVAAGPVQAFLQWRQAQIASGRVYADPDSPRCRPGASSAGIALSADVSGALVGDLNGDGRDDAYVAPGAWLCDGGNAAIDDDFLVLSTPTGYTVDEERIVEARNRADFDMMILQRLVRAPDGMLVLEGTGYRYRDDDPRCCPSIERTVRYDARQDRVTVR